MLLAAAVAVMAVPAYAQDNMGTMGGGSMGPGMREYNSWQTGWDQGHYDHQHVILGRVVSFAPYRVTVQRRNGMTQTVDLRNGTVIRPRGMTPSAGQRIAMIGRYSHGTFVVSRLVLRP
jgi:hypothetical protein